MKYALMIALLLSGEIVDMDPNKDDLHDIHDLIAELKSPRAKVRRETAYWLGQCGSRARVAASALGEALNDKDENVCSEAARALAQIGEAGVPPLVAGLKGKSDHARRYSAEALQRLAFRERHVRTDKTHAAPAVPALIPLLKDSDVKVRRAAGLALAAIGLEADKAVPALLVALKDRDEDVVCVAIRALGEIGPKAKAALPSLLDVLQKNQKGAIRWNAIRALGNIGAEAKSAVPNLLKVVEQDKDPFNALGAARSLGEMGPAAKSAVPALIRALKQHKDKEVRVEVALTLGHVDPQNKVTVPALIDLLSDADEHTRNMAAFVLGEIGPAAPAAIPALKARALNDSDDEVRAMARRALRKIEGKRQTERK